MFIAFLTNFVSIYLLVRLFNAEGKRYFDILRFSRVTWKTDLFWFIGFSIIGLPIAAVVKDPLAVAIFGDAMTPVNMLFRPLPTWAFVLGFLFPLTIAFSELPTYFGYCMPRLEAQLKNGWVAWLIASFFLAAQHMFLPLILDWGFMLWRLGMFLPFALFTGLCPQIPPGAFAILCDRPRADGCYNYVGLFNDINPLRAKPTIDLVKQTGANAEFAPVLSF